MRVLDWALLMALGAAVAAPRASAQTATARFDVDSVGDSTLTFAVGTARWVSPGRTGLAVEPLHHDELIARIKIIRVDHGTATALITGQTARVVPGQVALLRQPPPPFYKVGLFWIGAAVGAAIALIASR
jgi:hypothetical protein